MPGTGMGDLHRELVLRSVWREYQLCRRTAMYILLLQLRQIGRVVRAKVVFKRTLDIAASRDGTKDHALASSTVLL